MSIVQIYHQFVDSEQFSTVVVLLAADLVFGVLAAVKTRTFDLSRIADLLKTDVLGKVIPWAAVFVFALSSAGGEVAGVNFSTMADAVFAGVCLALAGSLMNSFQDLGLPLPDTLAKVGIGRAAQAPVAYPVDQGDKPPAA